MQQLFRRAHACESVRIIKLRLLLKEAFALGQLRDQLIWQLDGTTRKLSEQDRVLLFDLERLSARLVATIRELMPN